MSFVPVWCKPVISPSGPHVIVPKRGKLELRCHDNATTPDTASRLRWLRERARRIEGEVEEGGITYIKVPSVQTYHMGRYVCVNNNTMEHSSIYVYVKGEWGGEMWNCLHHLRRSTDEDPVFHLLRPSECLPAHHSERHPGACG